MSKTPASQKVMQASIELMTGRGYAATSVDDIVRRAGVAKGSFYHAFKSKEELALASLEHYMAQGMSIIAHGAYLDIRDPVERVLAFLQHVEDKSPELWSHGCMLGTLAIEVADSNPALIGRIDSLFGQLEQRMRPLFAAALDARGVTTVTAEELSIHLLAVIEGAIITARSHSRPEYLTDGIKRFRHYLALLLQ